jgi:hypothetical protein
MHMLALFSHCPGILLPQLGDYAPTLAYLGRMSGDLRVPLPHHQTKDQVGDLGLWDFLSWLLISHLKCTLAFNKSIFLFIIEVS